MVAFVDKNLIPFTRQRDYSPSREVLLAAALVSSMDRLMASTSPACLLGKYVAWVDMDPPVENKVVVMRPANAVKYQLFCSAIIKNR